MISDAVRREETPRGPRIIVPLGGEEAVLGLERAQRLRDELSAALGAGSETADLATSTDGNRPGANSWPWTRCGTRWQPFARPSPP